MFISVQISHHCVAQGLALASAQASSFVKYLDEFKSVLGQLFRFYDKSAVRLATLRSLQVGCFFMSCLNDGRHPEV